ncbi:MAG: sialidase family protein [Bacteroidales bacterium]|nr:sialidase family protein [Bacteroidales bacterium]
MNNKLTRIFSMLLCLAMTCGLNAATPFTVTTIQNGQFDEGTVWYTLTIGAGKLRIANNDGAESITLGGQITGVDAELWCFVGNESDGYLIYNKEAGPAMALAAPTTMLGSTGAESYAILKDAAAPGDGYTNRWDFAEATQTSSGGSLSVRGGYYVNEHGYASNILNNRNNKLAFWSTGYDNGSVILIEAVTSTYTVNMTTGSYTSANATGTYASVWSSTQTTPQLTLSTGANNMATNGNNLTLTPGTAGNSVYTLSAGSDYKVTGYKFTYKNKDANTNALKIVAGGVEYAVTDEAQTVELSGLNDVTAQFTFTGHNHEVEVSNFTVNVSRSFRQPEPQQDLFVTDGSRAPYRIPAIAKAYNGDLIAISDYRPCGGDIGFGEVDIVARISTDNGQTWGEEFTIGNGTGTSGAVDCGFGDAAVVADSESSEVLLISVCGNTVYGAGTTTRQNPNRVARFRSHDNGHTWSAYEEITEDIYTLFDESALGPVQSLFFGSGRICQSRQVKVGDYYRIYAALCARPGGNRVVYSDDFGQTWKALGDIDISPAPSGDEPKCEELPDGTVILSSRMSGGRYFNFFTYTDVAKGEGSWANAVASNSSNNGVIAEGNSTNGEILILPVKRTADNAEMYLALQSVPLGSGRANVGVYYKELSSLSDLKDAASFASNWDGRHQASYIGSAYSTMIMQANDSIAFFYEEETYGRAYTNVYKQYSVKGITQGAYIYDPQVDRVAFVTRLLRERVSDVSNLEQGQAVGMIDADKADELATSLDGIVEGYAANPTVEGYAAALNELNSKIDEAKIRLENGRVYTLENKERAANPYLGTSTATDNIDGTHQIYQGYASVSGNEQKFGFLLNEDGTWKIFNEAAQTYMSVTQNYYKHVLQVADVAEAGNYRVTSSTDGWSQLVCTTPVAAAIPALHLSGENKLVQWAASEPASQWKIVPTNDMLTAIGQVEREASQTEVRMYDLQGRRLQQIPAQGLYITSDKKKHLR